MRLLTLGCLLLGCSLVLAANSLASEVVDETIEVARSLPPLERANALLIIADDCVEISPEKSTRLALDVLELVRSGLPGSSQLAIEKNALLVLARTQPGRAVQAYLSLRPNPGFTAEDIRADGAEPLFGILLDRQGKAAIPDIYRIVRYLAGSGQYPFRGIGMAISRYLSDDPRTSERLLRAALDSFAKPSGYRAEVHDFAEMVFRSWRAAPVKLLREEVAALQAALSRLPADPRGSVFEVCSDNGCARFPTQREMLMFRLSPLISRIGGSVRPVIGAAPPLPDEPALVVSVLRSESVTDKEFQARVDEQRILQMYDGVKHLSAQPPRTAFMFTDPHYRITELRHLSAREVSLAARYVDRFQDEGKKTLIRAALAPAYAAVDQKVAKEWLLEARQALSHTDPGLDKVRLGLVIALGLTALGDRHQPVPLFLQSLDLGMELYGVDLLGAAGTASYVSDYLGCLCGSTEQMAHADTSEYLLSRISRAGSPALRAALLSSYARERAAAADTVGGR